MARQWILTGQEGFQTSLEYQENVPIPQKNDLGPYQVLVKLYAASLNYRELMISDHKEIVGPIRPGLVPGCDGAGIVEATGSSVREFQPGDRIVTYVAGAIAEARGDDAPATIADAPQMLGHGLDGTLRSHGVFSEKSLVRAPESLAHDWAGASTLPVTFTTAWNSLFGQQGRSEFTPDTWVLVQGTGGVSIAALQLARAAGGNVVATTSTEDKAARLRSLGATATVNYRANPDGWGLEARKLTPGGRGFDVVVDVGGDETLGQSLAAVRPDGTVALVGQLGGAAADPVPLMAVFYHSCYVRGVLASTRAQFANLVRFIDEKDIKPVVDDVVFDLAEAKDAYRRLKEKKHFSKVIIKIHDAEN